MYVERALYQICSALARPMPVSVELSEVGELYETPLMVFAPLPSLRR